MNTNSHVQRASVPGQIQFRVGHPLHFVTTRPFTLGSTGVQVRAGTDIMFDGTNAEVDGTEYKIGYLRGAVKAGWMVLAEDYIEGNPDYTHRTAANIQVRPVNGGNPLNPSPRMQIATTESDEREVGSAVQHANRTAAHNKGYVRGQTPVNVVTPGTQVRTQRGVMTVEPQDGIELDRKMQTPSGERSKERLDLTSEKAARAMHVAKNVQVQPGVGMTEEDMLSRMDEGEQELYLANKEALRSQYVNDSPAATQALPRPSSRQVVARVQSTKAGQHEGMQFRNSVGGGTQIGDESDGEVVGTVHSKDDIQVFEQEGMKFTTTNGPRRRPAPQPQQPQYEAPARAVASAEPPPPVPANLDVRRKIAKAVCPDFPESYDFLLSPKKKIARLQADFEDRADVLHAVYAAESDDMKALLLQEFPQAFAQ